MTVHFVIPGLPMGKQSVRGGGGRAYTATKTRNYMKKAREEYLRQVGIAFPDNEPLEIGIVAYFQIPTSKPKKWKALMRSGDTPPVVKPDWDNIAKVVCDSIQPTKKGENIVAFKDDSRIVSGVVVKRYSDNPRVEVWIREWRKDAWGPWWENSL